MVCEARGITADVPKIEQVRRYLTDKGETDQVTPVSNSSLVVRFGCTPALVRAARSQLKERGVPIPPCLPQGRPRTVGLEEDTIPRGSGRPLSPEGEARREAVFQMWREGALRRVIKAAHGSAAMGDLRFGFDHHDITPRQPRTKPRRSDKQSRRLLNVVGRLRNENLKNVEIVKELKARYGIEATIYEVNHCVHTLLAKGKIARRQEQKNKRPRKSKETLTAFREAVKRLFTGSEMHTDGDLLARLKADGFTWAVIGDVRVARRKLGLRREPAEPIPSPTLAAFEERVKAIYWKGAQYQKIVDLLKTEFPFATLLTVKNALGKLERQGKLKRSRRWSTRKVLIKGQMLTWAEYSKLHQGESDIDKQGDVTG